MKNQCLTKNIVHLDDVVKMKIIVNNTTKSSLKISLTQKSSVPYSNVMSLSIKYEYFTKKLFSVLFLLVLIGCSKESEEIKTNEFYCLNIEYEGIILKDEKTEMILYETLGDETWMYEGRIERRGGNSICFPKHSYEIDLEMDVSLSGLPLDDDWILNANYIDKTFLRHVISYELFQEMHPNNIASNTKYIELQLNNSYNGLYVLMEKLDKSSLKIDDDDSASVIFKEPHIFRESYDTITPQNPDNFHQQTYPEIENHDKTAFIENVRNFILNSSDQLFTAQFEEVFDHQSVIDWHLLLLMTNNGDGILKNFYLYKIDSKTPLRISVWDYDHSFGRDGDNELNLDTRPLDITRSILFSRLLAFDWYKFKIKTRWVELNEQNILSVNGLKNKIASKKNIIAELAEKNFQKWSISSEWYYDGNIFEEEIQIMYQFIDLRHNRLTNYFDDL